MDVALGVPTKRQGGIVVNSAAVSVRKQVFNEVFCCNRYMHRCIIHPSIFMQILCDYKL